MPNSSDLEHQVVERLVEAAEAVHLREWTDVDREVKYQASAGGGPRTLTVRFSTDIVVFGLSGFGDIAYIEHRKTWQKRHTEGGQPPPDVLETAIRIAVDVINSLTADEYHAALERGSQYIEENLEV